MNEAVAAPKAIKSDTSPGRKVIFSDLIVLDFEPGVAQLTLAKERPRIRKQDGSRSNLDSL